MELDQKIINKSTDVQPKWLALFRILLGFILFWKGIMFIQDSALLETIFHQSGMEIFDKYSTALTFIIPYINLLGGLFMASGLFTRWTALIEIPILVGAVLFASVHGSMSFSNKELLLSFVTLILLIVFVIKGSGYISADEFFKTYTNAGTEDGKTQNLFK